MDELQAKEARLDADLRSISSLIVAYSGGVDSAYLAYAAAQALGEKVLAITALSESYSARDREIAKNCARAFGIPHEFINTSEVEDPKYRANNPDRCFFCKSELFTKLDELAAQRGFAAVAYGINVDDQGDWRPGHRAARDHAVLAPLLKAGLTKADIRELARRAGIPVWDRPASACLASRIAYGLEVTPERLAVIEKGEEAVRSLGFRQFRVRHHGNMARLEIAPEELSRALTSAMAAKFVEIFKSLGFVYVTLDLEGYRRGSLNASLTRRQSGQP
ncbi:MAG: ATP-dependent sacrificial sulfur transferase LarE [Acidobacteriota bacterium]|nr:ATP-dependent sacrificial sulfur transferase LarE [Acidobacteriota bacterium]